MTENIENLTHEMLRRTHGKLEEIQTEMRLRFSGVESGLAAIEHHLAAFHLSDAARADEITDLRRRVERIGIKGVRVNISVQPRPITPAL